MIYNAASLTNQSTAAPKSTDARGKVFDYNETEKAHMEEKRKEYNEYLTQVVLLVVIKK